MTDLLKACHLETVDDRMDPHGAWVHIDDNELDTRWIAVNRIAHHIGYEPDMSELTGLERQAILLVLDQFNMNRVLRIQLKVEYR